MGNSELTTESKTIKALTVEEILGENAKLIFECLYTADRLYENLTSNSFLRENTDSCQHACILSDLSNQNESLNLLNRILKAINANVLKEEK